jgi:hypothetical protein
MGKLVKALFIVGITALLVVFLMLGAQAAKATDTRISNLETQISVIEKKRGNLIEKSLSLEEVKNNLTTQIAMETDKALQLELQKNLTALKTAAEQAKLLEMQKIAQAKANAAEQARLLQLQQQQAQAVQAAQTTRIRQTQIVAKTTTPRKTSAS